ncbi:MAG: hypothetical protein L0332_32705 [Chloroflexi bacterium]|nr:hypothetical protein [Chloroflexota bacterium]MCI0575321.1 hypothetical protein [Chloroflexota bacterium]MCI0649786.1 hypothetical protein [Chloroflexota bacterium]MCI0731464.1 hypothetical protein [Chloroflexota bacterium]
MLRLTPLEETIDGKELLQNQAIELLTEQIALKFAPSSTKMDEILEDLKGFDLAVVKTLFKKILQVDTVEELEAWIDEYKTQSNTGNLS